MNYFSAAALLAPAVLFGCSEIKTDSYEVELTTDTDPHLVELWSQTEELSNERAPLYRLRMPQSYFAFRDNHAALRQTTIGLMLDKSKFAPLTEAVHRETGVEEGLSTPSHHEGALKEQIEARYGDRQLFFRIIGSTGGLGLRRPPQQKLLQFGTRFRRENGFAIVERPRTSSPGNGSPDLLGYSLADPVIEMRCGAKANCTFFTDYRGSRISFVLPRSEMRDAPEIARKITHLLDQHLVPAEVQQ